MLKKQFRKVKIKCI